jgi:hypothetical protein
MLLFTLKPRVIVTGTLVWLGLLTAASTTGQVATSVHWPKAAPSAAAAPCPLPPEAQQTEILARHARNQPLLPGHERIDYFLAPARPGEPLVLMTISGGGSRSAYYAVRVMEELSKIPAPQRRARPAQTTSNWLSVLDTVRAISTVSAGGLAAGYYLLHYDERYNPDFYPRFREAMAVNLQWRTYGHMALFPPLANQ